MSLVLAGTGALALPSGSTLAATPAQFDSSLLAATTAFVQRALGSYSGLVIYSSSLTLTAADIGKYIQANTAGMNVTLPDATTLPLGATYTIQATSSVASGLVTITSVNGNFGGNGPDVGVATLSLPANTTVELVASSSGWLVNGQSGSSRLAASGFQKLPSGLIVQWGNTATSGGSATVTLPITYPNTHLIAIASENNASGWTASNLTVYGVYTRTVSQFTIKTWHGMVQHSRYPSATQAGFRSATKEPK